MLNLLMANTPVIIDVVAIAFVAIFTIRGITKGFAKLFVSVFGTIFSLLFAVLLCASTAKFLEDKFSLVTSLTGSIGGILDSLFKPEIMNTTLEHATSEKLSELGLGSGLSSIILSFAQDNSIPTTTTLNEILCPTFAYYAVMGISILGLFIIFKILFFLAGAFVKKLHAIKLVAVVDKSLGFFVGLISGIIYLELVIIVLGVIPIPAVQNIYTALGQTVFAKFINDISLYQVILDALSSVNVTKYVKEIIKI